MSMRRRVKTHGKRYPKWLSKQNSPARLCKERDGWHCVLCGEADRTLKLDEDGKPHHIVYLHAAHVNPLDPQYERIESIEDEVLLAMCPSCHRSYDAHWAEVEHELLLHRILLSQRYTNTWIMDRFTTVV